MNRMARFLIVMTLVITYFSIDVQVASAKAEPRGGFYVGEHIPYQSDCFSLDITQTRKDAKTRKEGLYWVRFYLQDCNGSQADLTVFWGLEGVVNRKDTYMYTRPNHTSIDLDRVYDTALASYNSGTDPYENLFYEIEAHVREHVEQRWPTRDPLSKAKDLLFAAEAAVDSGAFQNYGYGHGEVFYYFDKQLWNLIPTPTPTPEPSLTPTITPSLTPSLTPTLTPSLTPLPSNTPTLPAPTNTSVPILAATEGEDGEQNPLVVQGASQTRETSSATESAGNTSIALATIMLIVVVLTAIVLSKSSKVL